MIVATIFGGLLCALNPQAPQCDSPWAHHREERQERRRERHEVTLPPYPGPFPKPEKDPELNDTICVDFFDKQGYCRRF